MGNLGQKVREARQARNLTLREVARRAGLTASLISQIERGLANPSVSSLLSIANVLGLSMDYFFETTNRAPAGGVGSVQLSVNPPSLPANHVGELIPMVRAAERDVVNIAGGVQWQRLTPKHDQTIEFIELRYDVGSSSGDLAYRHRGREYGVVLQGRLAIELGFNRYVLEPGDSISFDCTVPHRLVNIGDTPVIGIWVILDRY